MFWLTELSFLIICEPQSVLNNLYWLLFFAHKYNVCFYRTLMHRSATHIIIQRVVWATGLTVPTTLSGQTMETVL